MDPLCEKYYDVSPYVYCLNNPIGNTDPDGRSVWTKGVTIALKVGAKVFRNGWKELGKAANYADAVSDITDNTKTLFDSNASTAERIGAGLSLASEALPVSLGDVKDVSKAIKVVHGNSKTSTKAQHAYDIIDKRTENVVKTGGSGGRIRKDKKSYRAEQQVKKWNKKDGGDYYKSKITHTEPAGEGQERRF